MNSWSTNFKVIKFKLYVFPSERLIILSQQSNYSDQITAIDLPIYSPYAALTRSGVGRWPLVAQNNSRIALLL